MLFHNSCRAMTLLAALLFLGQSTRAEDQKKSEKNITTIKVEGMTCGGCAKKVQQFVAKINGVEKVEPDLKAQTIKVFPKENAKVSAKEMWEAVEKAGYTPSELDGPSGSSKEKPKS